MKREIQRILDYARQEREKVPSYDPENRNFADGYILAMERARKRYCYRVLRIRAWNGQPLGLADFGKAA